MQATRNDPFKKTPIGFLSRTRQPRRLRDQRLPLVDDDGIVVIRDRRKLADRRKPRCGLADLRKILAKLAESPVPAE